MILRDQDVSFRFLSLFLSLFLSWPFSVIVHFAANAFLSHSVTHTSPFIHKHTHTHTHTHTHDNTRTLIQSHNHREVPIHTHLDMYTHTKVKSNLCDRGPSGTRHEFTVHEWSVCQ